MMINLSQGLDVVGDKRNWDDAYFAPLLRGDLPQCLVQRRLQPSARAHLALIAQAMIVGPSSLLHHQAHCLFNMPLVGVTLFDHRYRDTVCAEDERHIRQMGKAGKRLINPPHYGCDVLRITIKSFDTGSWDWALPLPSPLIQAAAGCRARILRIER